MNYTKTLAVIVTLALLPSLWAVDIIGGPVTNTASGHIYYLLGESSWPDAEAKAVRLGGHLVTINSQLEQDWVFGTFGGFAGNTNRSLWTGMRKSADAAWAWVSGEPVTYVNWAPGEPTGASWEDTVQIDSFRWDPPGQWNNNAPDRSRNSSLDPLYVITYHGVVEVLPRHQWIKWPSSVGGNDHFYALTTTAYSNWFDAEAEAALFGGHLVSINSEAEQQFLTGMFIVAPMDTNIFWIGLNDIVSEGVYVWSTGEPLTYANWGGVEPNDWEQREDAVVMNWHRAEGYDEVGTWNDYPVEYVHHLGIIETPAVETVFTKITSGPVVTSAGDSNGCAWGDYDDDGNLDLFVANHFGDNNLVYHGVGDGTFTRVTSGDIVNDEGRSTMGNWADCDNDGSLDIFVANWNGENNFLYLGTGGDQFVRVATGGIVNDGGFSACGAWGDYDADGVLDMFVPNTQGGGNFLYHGQGDGSFERVTSGAVVDDILEHSVTGIWGDYDGDGDLDLFVANQGGKSALYRNDGKGRFISDPA